METIAHPPIATNDAWLKQRLELLAEEKAHTKEYDRINAKRRRLPMVKVDKKYVFNGAEGEKTFEELFGDKTQLIIYHFMFEPDWDEGCGGCTFFVNALGNIDVLAERDTQLVLVSIAPYEKLAAYQKEMGWTIPWYSSEGTDFNYDFGVNLDPTKGPVSYNYKSSDQLPEDLKGLEKPTERHGQSVFFRVGNDVYHTYSSYGRAGESLTNAIGLLDITPYGRQEDFEDSPAGWPQKPTYG